MQDCLTSEEAEPQLTVRRDSQLEEKLRHTQEKLRIKEREVKRACHSSTFTTFLFCCIQSRHTGNNYS